MDKFLMGLCLGAFVILMLMRGAALQQERNELATRVEEQQRVITQLANRPTPAPIVVRVPVLVPVVQEAGSSVQLLGLLALAGAGVLTAGGGLWLVLLVATRPTRPATPDPALYPGDPGFDDAAARAAAAVGGVVSECEGVYWLVVPGRDPVRVRRLLESRG